MPAVKSIRRSDRKGLTLAEVAKVAGVATCTVSHILNNRTGCYASNETRQRVMKVARSLGYRPNLAARALRGGATRTFGFIDTVLEIEMVAIRCSAFEEAARRNGYLTTMSFNRPEDPALEDRLLQSLRARLVDGIVIVPVSQGAHTELRDLLDEGFPIVTMHGDPALGPACDVSIDFFAGGRLQGEHLVAQGRKRVCQVTRGGLNKLASARLAGLRESLDEAGCPPAITALLRSETAHAHRTDEQDYQDLRHFIREHRGQFDTIVGTNDEFALCAMRAALDEGLRVPDDAAIVGFDDIAAARLAAVPLTTVQLPAIAVAEKAIEVMLERVSGTRKAEDPIRVMIPPTLVVRQSTGGAQT